MNKMIICIVFCCSLSMAAFMPKFTKSGTIKSNGQDIKDIGCPTMCVTDWDGDGKKDLIIGEFDPSQKVRFYKNTGTNPAPVFTAYTYLKAGTADITLSGG